MTLQLNWFPEAEHGGYYAALVRGYYRDAGLDVKILPGGPNIAGDSRSRHRPRDVRHRQCRQHSVRPGAAGAGRGADGSACKPARAA